MNIGGLYRVNGYFFLHKHEPNSLMPILVHPEGYRKIGPETYFILLNHRPWRTNLSVMTILAQDEKGYIIATEENLVEAKNDR